MPKIELFNEDCNTTMSNIPPESVNMVMTSPPYWALRDYGTGKDQLGLESTFDEYINNLCDIFDNVKRILRPDGTIWINLGDTYSNNDKGGDNVMGNPEFARPHREKVKRPPKISKLPQKSLIMIPFRFAIEMVNRGWILRNTIVWHKNNVMPSSAKDRFTVDFEYLFFFSKNKKYFFNQQKEPHTSTRWGGKNDSNCKPGEYAMPVKDGIRSHKNDYPSGGKNKRTVWTINTKPFPGEMANRLNRNFIGSEISKEYYKIALKRLAPFMNKIDMGLK